MAKKLVPVKEEYAEQWAGPPGFKQYQASMKAHFNYNTSKREVKTYGLALCAYLAYSLFTLIHPWAGHIFGLVLVGLFVKHGITHVRAIFQVRETEAAYQKSIREVTPTAEEKDSSEEKSSTASAEASISA